MFDILVFISVYLIIGEVAIFVFCWFFKYGKKEIQIFSLGLVMRIVLTYGYYAYTLSSSADAAVFFSYSEAGVIVWKDLFTPGSPCIYNLAALFHYLVLPFENRYLMLYLPFSFLGFCGSVIFYRTLKPLFATRKKKVELFFLSFFLPNMVFWTSNLGKDSLVYFGLMLILYGVVNGPDKVKAVVSIIAGGIVVYFIRPHVVLFLLAGFGIGIFWDRRTLSFRTIVLALIVAVGFLVGHRQIFEFIGVAPEVESEEGFGGIYHAGVGRMEESSKNLGSMGGASTGARKFNILFAPYYLVQFLGSPFIWQARKPIQLAVALENILYQFFLLYFLFHWKAFASSKLVPYKYSLLLYCAFSSIIMGMSYTNFGLTVRERCMVLPFIIVFYASVRTQLFLEGKKRAQRKAEVRSRVTIASLDLQPQPKQLH